MFCTNCGTMRPLGATACPNCAMRFNVSPPPPPSVPNYLVGAILSTACCCLPLGIVSIVYAAQVNTKLQVGDVNGAVESSAKAKNWMIASILSGLLISGIYFAFMVLGIASGAASQ